MGVEKELQIVAPKPRAVSRNLKPICFQYFFLPKMNISDASRSLELLGFNSSGRKSTPSPKKKWHLPQLPKKSFNWNIAMHSQKTKTLKQYNLGSVDLLSYFANYL